MPEVVELINNLRPDILFVGLGSPRQELWIAEQFPNLNVKVCQAVGGTLDVLAGDVKRAPKIFRSMGFEWFYRLMAQPSRFSRQRALPVFAFRVLGAAMRHYVGYFGMRRAIHTDRQ
jgi:N-acetylglucosaminyldiphosphoundecaprenol N-acetyl-beta-D-mannosaminyltransferase